MGNLKAPNNLYLKDSGNTLKYYILVFPVQMSGGGGDFLSRDEYLENSLYR